MEMLALFVIALVVITLCKIIFNSLYFNRLSELKFHNDEIDIQGVNFKIRNLFDELKSPHV